jgi:hypothetical protein
MVLTERFGATRYVAGRRPSFRETELRSYPETLGLAFMLGVSSSMTFAIRCSSVDG